MLLKSQNLEVERASCLQNLNSNGEFVTEVKLKLKVKKDGQWVEKMEVAEGNSALALLTKVFHKALESCLLPTTCLDFPFGGYTDNFQALLPVVFKVFDKALAQQLNPTRPLAEPAGVREMRGVHGAQKPSAHLVREAFEHQNDEVSSPPQLGLCKRSVDENTPCHPSGRTPIGREHWHDRARHDEHGAAGAETCQPA